jgi:hypothetical protein
LKTDIPVLLIAWKRTDTLRQVINSLRMVTPRNVFLACDGPHADRPEEAALVSCVREMLLSEIDWSCQVEKKFSTSNKGCQRAVGEAIHWFFESVPEGIILEDDCVPHPDFFPFCSDLLEKYRHDERVGCITGDNFQDGLARGDASYYFSKYPHCWGWATWRRAWEKYSPSIEFWPEWRKSKDWITLFKDSKERFFWEELFDQQHGGKIDSWAYPWTASLWRAGSLTVTPQHNLVQNIGFGGAATHTKDIAQKMSVPTNPLKITAHPQKILPHISADQHVFKYVFCNQKKGLDFRILRLMQLARSHFGKVLSFIHDRTK